MKPNDGRTIQFTIYYNKKSSKATRMMKSIKRAAFFFKNRRTTSSGCNQKAQKIRLKLTNTATKLGYFTK
jgi:hypothetical protein